MLLSGSRTGRFPWNFSGTFWTSTSPRKMFNARSTPPQNTPPAALESKPQAAARAAPVAHDRSAHIILPQIRRTRHPPVTRSTAYRKDAPAPPPTPCARSRCLLASPHHSAYSSPCAHATNDPCGSHHLFFQVPRLAPRAAKYSPVSSEQKHLYLDRGALVVPVGEDAGGQG